MRYFLDLHECGVVTMDPEGVELVDDEAARGLAVRSARSLMSGEVNQGRLCLGCCIEVYDPGRRHVLSVPFRDVVTVTGL